MSKYIDQLTEQLKGKNIMEFTKHIKANNDLSKILRDQRETEKKININKDIQKLLQK